MTIPTDLLDRVAAANPVPPAAPPSAAEQREADALLERLLDTHVAPRRPRRTRRLILAGATAAAIAGTVVAVVADRGPSIVDRAYAAVSGDSLYHVVRQVEIDAPAHLTRGDLALPRRDTVIESWYDLQRRDFREVLYELRDGRRALVREAAGSAAGTTIREPGREPRAVENVPGAGPPDVESFDPTAEFKTAYREDDIREQGTVMVDGRRAHRLVIETGAQPGDAAFRVRSSRAVALFDARTMFPIEWIEELVIDSDGRRDTVVVRVRYTTFETLPRTTENLAELRLPR